MGNLRQRHAVGSDRCVTRAAEAQAHAEARWRHSLGAKARLSIKGPAQAKSRYKSKGTGQRPTSLAEGGSTAHVGAIRAV